MNLSGKSNARDFEEIERYYGVKTGDLLLLELEDPSNGIIVGSGRTIYFSQKTDTEKIFLVLNKYILRNDALVLTRNALNDPAKFSLDEENRRRFPASPSFDVLLTFINSNPDQLQLERSLSKNINGIHAYYFLLIKGVRDPGFSENPARHAREIELGRDPAVCLFSGFSKIPKISRKNANFPRFEKIPEFSRSFPKIRKIP